jgi:Zn-dependent protease with chaperone function
MIDFDLSENSQLEISFRFNLLLSIIIIGAVFVLQIVFIYLGSYILLRQVGIVQIYPKITASAHSTHYIKNGELEKYNHQELVKTVQTVAEKAKVTISKIYVTFTHTPNAFTFKIPFVHGSIININTNILDVLSEEEIEAVVSHEVAHIKNNDSLLKMLLMAPSPFLNLSFFYLYSVIGITILTNLLFDFNLISAMVFTLILGGAYLITKMLAIILKILLLKSERKAELLADIFAARMTSPIITINMLIHIGQRVEALCVLMAEFKNMELIKKRELSPEDQQQILLLMSTFPVHEFDERQAKLIAPYLFLKNELSQLREYYFLPLTDLEIEELVVLSIKRLEKAKKISLDKEEDGFSWRNYDLDCNKFLDKEELELFVNDLKNDPVKFVFSSEGGTNYLLKDHPGYRKRILTIYEEFEKNLA